MTSGLPHMKGSLRSLGTDSYYLATVDSGKPKWYSGLSSPVRDYNSGSYIEELGFHSLPVMVPVSFGDYTPVTGGGTFNSDICINPWRTTTGHTDEATEQYPTGDSAYMSSLGIFKFGATQRDSFAVPARSSNGTNLQALFGIFKGDLRNYSTNPAVTIASFGFSITAEISKTSSSTNMLALDTPKRPGLTASPQVGQSPLKSYLRGVQFWPRNADAIALYNSTGSLKRQAHIITDTSATYPPSSKDFFAFQDVKVNGKNNGRFNFDNRDVHSHSLHSSDWPLDFESLLLHYDATLTKSNWSAIPYPGKWTWMVYHPSTDSWCHPGALGYEWAYKYPFVPLNSGRVRTTGQQDLDWCGRVLSGLSMGDTTVTVAQQAVIDAYHASVYDVDTASTAGMADANWLIYGNVPMSSTGSASNPVKALHDSTHHDLMFGGVDTGSEGLIGDRLQYSYNWCEKHRWNLSFPRAMHMHSTNNYDVVTNVHQRTLGNATQFFRHSMGSTTSSLVGELQVGQITSFCGFTHPQWSSTINKASDYGHSIYTFCSDLISGEKLIALNYEVDYSTTTDTPLRLSVGDKTIIDLPFGASTITGFRTSDTLSTTSGVMMYNSVAASWERWRSNYQPMTTNISQSNGIQSVVSYANGNTAMFDNSLQTLGMGSGADTASMIFIHGFFSSRNVEKRIVKGGYIGSNSASEDTSASSTGALAAVSGSEAGTLSDVYSSTEPSSSYVANGVYYVELGYRGVISWWR